MPTSTERNNSLLHTSMLMNSVFKLHYENGIGVDLHLHDLNVSNTVILK